jgi:hypothetical protein
MPRDNIDSRFLCPISVFRGDSFLIALDPTSTILDMRTKVETAVGLLTTEYNLLEKVEDDRLVWANSPTLGHLQRPRFTFYRSAVGLVRAKLMTRLSCTIDCQLTDTILDVKRKLTDLERISPDEQKIVYNNKKLDDGMADQAHATRASPVY